MPVVGVGEDAAEQHADAAAAGADEAVDAHRLGALGRLGEEVHQQRQRDRLDDRAADALHRPGDDQRQLRARQAAGERGEAEQGDADHEQAPLPVEVAEPPAEQQEAAAGEHVGVDDPDQGGLGKAEVGTDRRQGDVDDRHVEHGHQDAEADDAEGQPAGGCGERAGHRPDCGKGLRAAGPRRCSSCRRRRGRCAASSSPGRRRSGARRRGRRCSTAPASIPGRRAAVDDGAVVRRRWPGRPGCSAAGPAVSRRRPTLSEGRVGTIGPAGSTLRAVRVAMPHRRVEAQAHVELAARQRHPVRVAVDLGAGRPALGRLGRATQARARPSCPRPGEARISAAAGRVSAHRRPPAPRPPLPRRRRGGRLVRPRRHGCKQQQRQSGEGQRRQAAHGEMRIGVKSWLHGRTGRVRSPWGGAATAGGNALIRSGWESSKGRGRKRLTPASAGSHNRPSVETLPDDPRPRRDRPARKRSALPLRPPRRPDGLLGDRLRGRHADLVEGRHGAVRARPARRPRPGRRRRRRVPGGAASRRSPPGGGLPCPRRPAGLVHRRVPDRPPRRHDPLAFRPRPGDVAPAGRPGRAAGEHHGRRQRAQADRGEPAAHARAAGAGAPGRADGRLRPRHRQRLALVVAADLRGVRRLARDLHADPRGGPRPGPSGRPARHSSRAACRRIARRQPFVHEYRCLRPDGRIAWIGHRGQAEYDAGGRPVRSFGVSLDITERKLAEQALQEADRQEGQLHRDAGARAAQSAGADPQRRPAAAQAAATTIRSWSGAAT